MEKKEPKIIAEGFTNDELYQWMRGKTRNEALLRGALAERESLKQALVEVEGRIEELTSSAAFELLGTIQDPTQPH